MPGSITVNALPLRQAARAEATRERRARRAKIPVDRHADPLASLAVPLTLPKVFQLILLGLGTMLLPVLLPLAFGRRRRRPTVF